ncbi:chitobiase/beta-hexosaminidase C-terminal domain-containing protein [Streptomyces sp. NPDC048462]|uniref:chitobiase/beta-hexosaminidase C-terminal domain-containing protein n=1 Tax=Streptomyces sp. NPDC048462 TaxID=3365555 RepID=UPI003722AA88
MRLTPLVIASAALALAAPAAVPATAQARPQSAPPAAPGVSVPGGRYDHTVSLKFRAGHGDTVRYTLDGRTPTRESRAYRPGRPLRITEDTNVTAVAFRGGRASVPVAYGYLIKTKEKPLARFVVMSDVHVGDHENNDKKYESFFDTIGSVFPHPDAILSNGDMINDNGDGKGPDHRIVSDIFRSNLKRKGMTGTQLLISNGNHDDSLAAIRAGYPKAWFPDSGGGYYESDVKGVHLLTVNTETYDGDASQRTWLKNRLTALTTGPGASRKPVLVQGHRPTTGTTMDGQQASNPGLAADLSAFPQAILFSGHSHLNVNDDRSMYQRDFTSVNDGSMSYVEVDHGYQMVTDNGLADRFEAPTAQALFVEIYKDRTEIDRINMAADKHDIYTGGQWSASWQPPYASAGTLAGPGWTVRLKGSTNQQIKDNFRYTAARRNTVAPQFTTRRPVTTARVAGGGTALRVTQAVDDQIVHHYQVDITDTATGAKVLSSEVLSDYYFMPRPNALDIPVPDAVAGHRYRADVVAVDAYGNAARPVSLTFTG